MRILSFSSSPNWLVGSTSLNCSLCQRINDWKQLKNILVHFCLTKNNGFVSRLLGGMEKEVVEHVLIGQLTLGSPMRTCSSRPTVPL